MCPCQGRFTQMPASGPALGMFVHGFDSSAQHAAGGRAVNVYGMNDSGPWFGCSLTAAILPTIPQPQFPQLHNGMGDQNCGFQVLGFRR